MDYTIVILVSLRLLQCYEVAVQQYCSHHQQFISPSSEEAICGGKIQYKRLSYSNTYIDQLYSSCTLIPALLATVLVPFTYDNHSLKKRENTPRHGSYHNKGQAINYVPKQLPAGFLPKLVNRFVYQLAISFPTNITK